MALTQRQIVVKIKELNNEILLIKDRIGSLDARDIEELDSKMTPLLMEINSKGAEIHRLCNQLLEVSRMWD